MPDCTAMEPEERGAAKRRAVAKSVIVQPLTVMSPLPEANSKPMPEPVPTMVVLATLPRPNWSFGLAEPAVKVMLAPETVTGVPGSAMVVLVRIVPVRVKGPPPEFEVVMVELPTVPPIRVRFAPQQPMISWLPVTAVLVRVMPAL